MIFLLWVIIDFFLYILITALPADKPVVSAPWVVESKKTLGLDLDLIPPKSIIFFFPARAQKEKPLPIALPHVVKSGFKFNLVYDPGKSDLKPLNISSRINTDLFFFVIFSISRIHSLLIGFKFSGSVITQAILLLYFLKIYFKESGSVESKVIENFLISFGIPELFFFVDINQSS